MQVSQSPCTQANDMGTALPPPSMPYSPKRIADCKEGRLDYLCELPEMEFELSLTDLVLLPAPAEVNGDAAVTKTAEPDIVLGRMSCKEGGRRSCNLRRRSRSSANGVMLNMYFPSTLTASLMPGRPSRAGMVKQTKVFVEEDELSHSGASSIGCLKLFGMGGRTEAKETGKSWVGVRKKIVDKLAVGNHLII